MGRELAALMADIDRLPANWHGAGSVSRGVLEALERYARDVRRSIETGTGRTTLLLSHLSGRHTVFTKDDEGDGGSLDAVRDSALLHADRVTFVLGPTQRTLLTHAFKELLDLAYLDGPHAYPFPDLEYWAVYPHIAPGGLLVIDDIQIRTIGNLFKFLAADAMWDLVEVVDTTAFFRRTEEPGIDPFGEGWWRQGYNQRPDLSYLSLRGRLLKKARVEAGAIKRAIRSRSQGAKST